MRADRMCNAIQQRIIEERLVENEEYEAMIRMRHRINDVLGMDPPKPQGVPRQQRSKKERDTASQNAAPPRKSSKRNSPEWDYVYGDGSIPEPKRTVGPVATDVMAVGDVERDPTAPIAPYIPPTNPQEKGNPFPMLNGPMG